MRWPRGVRARLPGRSSLLVAVTAVVLGRRRIPCSSTRGSTTRRWPTPPPRHVRPVRHRARAGSCPTGRRWTTSSAAGWPTRSGAARCRDARRPGRGRARPVGRRAGRPARATAGRHAGARRSRRARLRLARRRRPALARRRRSPARRRPGVLFRARRGRRSSGRRTAPARPAGRRDRAGRRSPLLVARLRWPAGSSLRSRRRAGRPSGSSAATCSPACPVTSHDEFGVWADRFNRMTDTLAEIDPPTRGGPEPEPAVRRRRVARAADAADRARRGGIDPSASTSSRCRPRRDARPSCWSTTSGRLRDLVEELMELSRFDADAEEVALEPVDLGKLIESIRAARSPAATFATPPKPVVDRRRSRGGWSGSSATSSTTRESTPGTRTSRSS